MRRQQPDGDSTAVPSQFLAAHLPLLRAQDLDAGADPFSHGCVRPGIAGEAADRRRERPRLVARELRIAELLAEREVFVVLDPALDLDDARTQPLKGRRIRYELRYR